MRNQLIKYLSEFTTAERILKFNQILKDRTRYLTLAIEDIYQSQNISAVTRTCECLGIQDVHIIENKYKYKVNPQVTLGATKWINIIKHNSLKNNSLYTIKQLKSEGYRIVATSPHINSCLLNDFDITKGKTAIFFGTELKGLSDIVLNNSDEYIKIPIAGFTESFNISVSVAIIMFTLIEKIKKSNIKWELSAEEISDIKLQWLKTTIKSSKLLIQNYLNKNNLPSGF